MKVSIFTGLVESIFDFHTFSLMLRKEIGPSLSVIQSAGPVSASKKGGKAGIFLSLLLLAMLFLPALSFNQTVNNTLDANVSSSQELVQNNASNDFNTSEGYENNTGTETEQKLCISADKEVYELGEQITLKSNEREGLIQIVKPDKSTEEFVIRDFSLAYSTDEPGFYQVFFYTRKAIAETSFIVKERENESWLIIKREGPFAYNIAFKDKYNRDIGTVITTNSSPDTFDAMLDDKDVNIMIKNIRKGEQASVIIGDYNERVNGLRIVTPVILVENLNNFGYANITMRKSSYVSQLFRCPDFDSENFKCNGDWQEISTDSLSFGQNRSHIWFSTATFSAWAGGGATDTAGLVVSDINDTGTVPASTAAAPFYVKIQASYHKHDNVFMCAGDSIKPKLSLSMVDNDSRQDMKFYGVYATDLDNDTVTEIMVVGENTSNNEAYLSIWNFTPTNSPPGDYLQKESYARWRYGSNSTAAQMVWAGDIDGDGRMEIVVVGNYSTAGRSKAFVRVFNYTTGSNKLGSGTLTVEYKANWSYGGSGVTNFAHPWDVKVTRISSTALPSIALTGDCGCDLSTDDPTCSQKGFVLLYNISSSGSILNLVSNVTFVYNTKSIGIRWNETHARAIDTDNNSHFFVGGFHENQPSAYNGYITRFAFISNNGPSALHRDLNVSFYGVSGCTGPTELYDIDFYENFTSPTPGYNGQVVAVGQIGYQDAFIVVYNFFPISGNPVLENSTSWSSSDPNGFEAMAKSVYVSEMNAKYSPQFDHSYDELSWHSPLFHREISVGGYDEGAHAQQWGPWYQSSVKTFNISKLGSSGTGGPFRASTPTKEQEYLWYMWPFDPTDPVVEVQSFVEQIYSDNIDNRSAEKSKVTEIVSVGWEQLMDDMGMPLGPTHGLVNVFRYDGFVCNISFNDTATGGPSQGVLKQFVDWYPMWFNGSAQMDTVNKEPFCAGGPFYGNYTFFKEFNQPGTYAYNVSCSNGTSQLLSVTDTITVRNPPTPAPLVSNVKVVDWGQSDDGDIDITAHEYNHRITCNFTVDPQGYSLKKAKANFTISYKSSKIADDDNLHYSNDSCTWNISNGDGTYDFACLFRIQYYAKAGTWKCNVSIANQYNKINNTEGDTVTIPSITAVQINESALSFPTTAAGSNTSSPEYIHIINIGNTKIDVKINGTHLKNLTGGTFIIGVQNITYNKSYYGGVTKKGSTTADPSNSPRQLTRAEYTWSSLNLYFRNASTMNKFFEANATIAFKMVVPYGQSPRRYAGTLEIKGLAG
ncbi:hypothetical protein DRN74_02275 [Candidatus Micrarchaeota archaeon]|nr:MAG: hypothetical protein DRN74_02275 [Candidatus Micrarchaeota archaeon]